MTSPSPALSPALCRACRTPLTDDDWPVRVGVRVCCACVARFRRQRAAEQTQNRGGRA